MSYGQPHQRPESVITAPLYWWKRRKLRHNTSQPLKLPLPDFPPALDFNVDDFVSTSGSNWDVEKAVNFCAPSYDCGISTLSIATAYTSLSQPNVTTLSPSVHPKEQPRLLRHLRLTLFTVYRRIFSLIFIVNFIGLLLILRNPNPINIDHLATWASTNFLLSILIRAEFFVNFIFRTAWLVPWSVSLRIRRLVARVYTYGGVHSGTAVAGTMWFSAFTTLLSIRFARQSWYTAPIIVLTWCIFISLLLIILLAFPHLRSRYHNTFEMTHRFLGWGSIVLFWAQLLLLTYHSAQALHTHFAKLLIHQPTFWNLILLTAILIHPWLCLRKWTFVPEKLSSHALRLHFTKPIRRLSCLSISTSPLKEWHPFATFPSTDPLQPGGSMVISAAGDWTTSLISSPDPRTTFWVKGNVKTGVLSLSCIFRRVIIVTTGSGIGPALSSLLDKPEGQFCRLVWSTRSPIQTYGAQLCSEVERVDPDALIIDTDHMGRPDLVRVAWMMWRELQAEAVFVLSNEKVTRKVVYGLESRGVPAFGPIWDS